MDFPASQGWLLEGFQVFNNKTGIYSCWSLATHSSRWKSNIFSGQLSYFHGHGFNSYVKSTEAIWRIPKIGVYPLNHPLFDRTAPHGGVIFAPKMVKKNIVFCDCHGLKLKPLCWSKNHSPMIMAGKNYRYIYVLKYNKGSNMIFFLVTLLHTSFVL